jgi:WS/DGAT/MGAT family acyltransferase
MERLSGFDAWLLYSETPTAHQHTLKVAVLEPTAAHPFDLAHLRRRFERRLHLLPTFRLLLVEVPLGLHHPMWLQNCAVDLDYHIRAVALPAPGGPAELDAVLSEIASRPLDRTRPLWEMQVITGLENSQVALATKMHHALADGLASSNLLARATEPISDEELAKHPPAPPDPLPSKTTMLRMAMVDHAIRLRLLPGLVARTVVGLRRLRAHGPCPDPHSANVLKPPRTFLNRTLSERRGFTTLCLPLGEVREIKSALGVTLNDVVLSLAAGMLRRLLLEVEGRADEPLVASVAVSTDPSPTRIHGNRISGTFASLPVQLADPVQRCRSASAAATVAKQQHRLLGPELVQDWLEYLPPRPFQWYARNAARRRRADRAPARMNVVVSNVRGPREQISIAGYPVTSFRSVGPLYEGCGLNVTVWSYHDQLNFSVLADPDLLPDLTLVPEGIREEFRALQAAVSALSPECPPSRAPSDGSVPS